MAMFFDEVCDVIMMTPWVVGDGIAPRKQLVFSIMR